MRLTFLGTGSAFVVGDNFQSNCLIELDNKKKLLIDCGTDARHSLFAHGLTYHDIDNVFISHLHNDHAGGLEWLGLTRKFDSSCEAATLHISDKLVKALWETILSGSMRTLEEKEADIHDFFKVSLINEPATFEWSSIQFQLIKTKHYFSNHQQVPSYGLFFTVNGQTVFYTSDTQFTPELLMPYFKKADIIFHDCEVATQKSGVHANYEDLITLDEDIKAKMWLYHYSNVALPDAKKAGFLGFARKGQVFDFSE